MYFLFNRTTLEVFVTYLTCKPDPWHNPIERNHMGLHLENEVARRVASDHHRSHAWSIAAVNAGLKILWRVGGNGAGLRQRKTWSVVLLNKKYIYFYLKRTVYDKLLKARQSFWITLYFSADILTRNYRQLNFAPKATGRAIFTCSRSWRFCCCSNSLRCLSKRRFSFRIVSGSQSSWAWSSHPGVSSQVPRSGDWNIHT